MTVPYRGDVRKAMSRRWTSLRAVFVILATVTLCGRADSQGLTDPVEPTVTVQGVLQVGEFFGSPGYGEDPKHDSIGRYYYLQLPATVFDQNPDAIFGPSFERLDEFFVQLAFLPNRQPKQLMGLTGKKVKVTGMAWARETAGHRTGIVLLVERLTAVTAWSWPERP